MKTTILFLLLALNVIAQDKPVSTTYNAKVLSFSSVDAEYHETRLDTIIGQSRKITLANDETLFQLSWQLDNNDTTLYPMEYYINKVYSSVVYNKPTERVNFTSYLATDLERYPLLLMVSEDKSIAYLYYFWDSKLLTFQKCEKLMLYTSALTPIFEGVGPNWTAQ
jgi:hypothetical protein